MLSDTQIQLQAVRAIAMAPAFAVMLVGLIFAIRKMHLYPRSCWAILGALAISTFNMLGMPFLMWALMKMTGGFASTTDLMLRNLLWTLPHGLLAAGSWGLVLFAVFDRPDPPKFLHDEEGDRDVLDR